MVHAEADDEPSGDIDAGNDDEVTDSVSCECEVAIAKTVDPASGNPGDHVTYTYVVANTGTADVTDLTVDDDQLGQVGTAPSLAPGDEVTFHTRARLPAQGDTVVNVATVSATTDDAGRCSAKDEAVVTIVSAGGGGDDDGGNPPGQEGPGGGGTAFTGPADLPAGLMAILLLAGSGALALARRSRMPRGG